MRRSIPYFKRRFKRKWDSCYWLFDYFEGTIPELDSQKELFVFCSHSHEDHFSPSVFELAKKYPSVNYIFSNEVCNACKKLAKRESKELPVIHFLKSRTVTDFTTAAGEVMKIHTLLSTDCGCAFFIEYNGKSIYHAGDLHWWYWEGEDPDWNKKMTADYKKEMEYLEGKYIDLAFNVLDPRQEKDYALGMNYFLLIQDIYFLCISGMIFRLWKNTYRNFLYPMKLVFTFYEKMDIRLRLCYKKNKKFYKEELFYEI